jgi:hypothetical protein
MEETTRSGQDERTPEQVPGQAQGQIIERGERFSRSILWRLQRRYYAERGPEAWSTGTVPSYITSNPSIARCYASLVSAYLQDLLARGALDPAHPIYIMELASGPGRFAFLFLRQLMTLKQTPGLRDLDLRYVMTDFAESNLKSWRAQPRLRPFVESGVLHFGRFDLEHDAEISLPDLGQTLSEKTLRNPLICLGNYIFDTVAQDLFRIEGGKLSEALVTISARGPFDPERAAPEEMSQLSTNYEYRQVSLPYYGERDLDTLLAGYRERLGDTTVVFPIGTLRGLMRLLAIARGRLLLLSSDKGYVHEDELLRQDGQHIQFHGSLSMMVNYHAIGRLFLARGGHALVPEERQVSLKTVGFILDGERGQGGALEEAFPRAALAFREVDRFGPYDFFSLISSTRKECASASLEQVLALWRLSEWDPNIVHEFHGDLIARMDDASEAIRGEIRKALLRTYENFYPVGRDLPFEIARVFLAMKRPREGARFNEISLQLFGEHPVTYFNLGLCHYNAEEPERAFAAFTRSLELKPDYAPARDWKIRVETEVGRRA